MIDIELLPWEVVGDVYRNMEVDIDDDEDIKQANKQIAKMTPQQVLDRYLTWNGIIGYGQTIYNAVTMIQDCTINDGD
jgi:hypothetical protein